MIKTVGNKATTGAADLVLGTLGNAIARRDGKWHTHHTFGRIIEHLAAHVRRIEYFAPVLVESRANTCDFELSHPDIRIHPMDTWENSMRALRRPDRLIRHYWRLTQASDALFLRGTSPLIWATHWMARARGLRVVHWFGSNEARLLIAAQRGYGRFLERLGLCYAYSERAMTRMAASVSRAYVIANGAELARLYGSKRTMKVVSTSITADDFRVRDDTCNGEVIKILFVGFIRPEKGIEFLLRALPLIESVKTTHLALVGSWDQFRSEYERLKGLIVRLGLKNRVTWEGYAAFGRELFQYLDESDILVLPSLIEGTPRVLVEARARSLPVVSTRVGGIPDSVTDGQDGLLVPPTDPQATARAISRIIEEPALRQQLIRQGRERVKESTIDGFVDLILDLLTRPDAGL